MSAGNYGRRPRREFKQFVAVFIYAERPEENLLRFTFAQKTFGEDPTTMSLLPDEAVEFHDVIEGTDPPETFRLMLKEVQARRAKVVYMNDLDLWRYAFQDFAKLYPQLNIKLFGDPKFLAKIRVAATTFMNPSAIFMRQDWQTVDQIAEAVTWVLGKKFKYTFITAGAWGFSQLRKSLRGWKKLFPKTELLKHEYEISDALKTGLVYLNPKYRGRVADHVVSIDVNSMYPSIMFMDYLPYGEPEITAGFRRLKTGERAHQILKVRMVGVELKPDGLPFLSDPYLGGHKITSASELITTIDQWDISILKENYNVRGFYVLKTFTYKVKRGVLKKHVLNWWGIKKNATKSYESDLAKTVLNTIYGKFSQKREQMRNGKRVFMKDAFRYPAYSVAIGARGRRMLADMIKKIGIENVVYANTDNVHFVDPKGEITKNLAKEGYLGQGLGEWKLEYTGGQLKCLREGLCLARYGGEFHQIINGAQPMAFANFDEFDYNKIMKNFSVEFNKVAFGAIKVYRDGIIQQRACE